MFVDGIPLNRARCYGDLFGNLVIQNARESDSGTYLCNGQGQGQGQGRALLHTVRLKVTGGQRKGNILFRKLCFWSVFIASCGIRAANLAGKLGINSVIRDHRTLTV